MTYTEFFTESDWGLLLAGICLTLLLGLVTGGVYVQQDNPAMYEQEIQVTGDTTTEMSVVSSPIRYEELPQKDKSQFRSEQSKAYNGISFTLSENTRFYESYSHIQLDGIYYEISTEEVPTQSLNFLLLLGFVSTLLCFVSGVASVAFFITIIITDIIHRTPLHILKTGSIVFVILCVSVTMAFSFNLVSDISTVSVSEVSVDQSQSSILFEQLSEEEQADFIDLVAGNTKFPQNSELKRGTTISSDGEVYEVVYSSTFSIFDGIFVFVSGLIVGFLSALLSVSSISYKRELLYESNHNT